MDENDSLNDKLLREIDKMTFDGALLLESKAADIWWKFWKDKEKQLKDLFAKQD